MAIQMHKESKSSDPLTPQDNDNCGIFWPAFGFCALQTLVEIVIFSDFNGKKQKKNARNLQQNFAKNMFF